MRHAQVMRVLARSLLYFMAIFSVFAYVGPVLQALNPISANTLAATLVMFGLAGVVGTFLGGWSADRFGTIPTLAVNLLVLCAMMALVPLTRGHYTLCVVVFIVWGLAGFGLMAPQQSRLAQLMPQQTPLLLSLNASMMYIGTALGAAISGALLESFGFDRLAWVGLPLALMALGTLWWDRRA
jgi:DHA1 family inner membrane transport protein